MSDREITPNDVMAAVDVINSFIESIDDIDDMGYAGPMHEALEAAKQAIVDAISFLESRIVKLCDGQPVQVDERIYSVVYGPPKWRYDHRKVLDHASTIARRRAINPDTGEANTDEALAELVRLVEALYVSPSSWVKAGGLVDIGFRNRRGRADKAAVAEPEPGPKRVQVTEVWGD